MYKVDNFINGEASIDSSESSSIINPSYGTEIGEVLYMLPRIVQTLQ